MQTPSAVEPKVALFLGIPEQIENRARGSVLTKSLQARAERISPRVEPRVEWKSRCVSSLT